MTRCFFALTVLSAFVLFADVPVLYVKMATEGGSDTTGDGSWEKPYATISNAVEQALRSSASATRISVQPGTYPGGTRMEISVNGSWQVPKKTVDIRAQKRDGDADVDNPDPRETVIECAHRAGGAWLRNKSTICGFTIQNGVWQRLYELKYPHSPIGAGGVYLVDGAVGSNLIIRCCITKPDSRTLPNPDQGSIAAVCVSGAGSAILDSQILNCTNETTSANANGELNAAGLKLDRASLARNCIISNCWSFSGKSGDNHRGGGVYMSENSQSTLDSCQILDCGAQGCGGGGICLLRGVTVTNCLVSGCYSSGSGGGIGAEYGSGLIVDTTITNCTSAGSGCGINMSPATAAKGQLLLRCKISNCGPTNFPIYQAYGSLEDCVIENNTYRDGCILASLSTNSTYRNCVIRNNSPTKNTVLLLNSTGYGTTTVERCWFTGNRCQSNYGVLHQNAGNNMHFAVESCIFSGNSAGYGIYVTDNTQYTSASTAIQYLPEADRHVSTRLYNCTVAENALSGSGIYFNHANGTLGGPQYVAATNCLVAANTNSAGSAVQAFGFHATVKTRLDAHPEQVAYCAMTTGTGTSLPSDPGGVAHNQIGRTGFMSGTLVPNGFSVAVDHAYELAGMHGSKDMGDGSYTITKSADYGVHVVPNKAHRRITGSAPDIGASEYRPTGFIIIHRR